jgi:hypothetical protein
MANRKNTFLIKRSNTPGKIPSSGDLLLGELALNTADVILYASGTTANSILPIGWDRIARTGDTMTGTLYAPSISATTISATTYYGLPTDSQITAFTYNNANTFTLTNNTGGTLSASINTMTGLTVNGNITVTGNINTTLINATGGTSVFRSIEPLTDNTYVLGSTSKTWSNIHTREIRIYDSSGNDSIGITTPVLATSPDPAWNLVLPLLSGGTFSLLGTYSGGGNTSNTTWFNLSAGTNVTLTQSGNASGGTLAISSQDTYVTGGTYNTGTTVFTNNTGGTFTVTGYNTGLTNALSTGVYVFTGLSIASSTTFNVAPVSALIVDGTTDPLTPVVLPVYYSGGVHTALYISSATETYVYMTSAGTINQQITPLTDQERRQNVFLGKLGHANKTNIINAFSQPDFLQSPLAQLRDMFEPIGFVNGGIYASANTGLTFNTSAGYLHGLGINYASDVLNPDTLYVSGNTPTTFQYRTQTGGTASNTTLVDPTTYDLNGVATTIPGTKTTNQRIYLVQNGQFRIQYGQQLYSNLSAAIAGIATESFQTFSNFRDNAILIGVLSVNSNATDLTNPSDAQFFFASKFGETIGSAGGFSTTTLQQAYNNSSNPEIITNATQDGVQFRGGTGSDLDANIIIENNAGAITGRWNANGGLSATSISATTYYGLPTDVYTTGGTYSNGTATFTNNTGGTFTVTGFSTSTATEFTGGTVTGATIFTNGVTASTISATTYYGDGSNLTGIVASWDGLQVITAGENVNAGDLLYLSGDSKYYKVNNLLESKSSTELRLAVSAITANNTGSGLIQGQYTTTGLTAGAKYWVGSAGNYSTSQPTADNSIVRFVGTALSTTVLEFNPDQTWIEVSSVSAVPSTGSTNPSVRSITTSQTALANDETIICLSALTITLPTAVGIAGKTYNIKSRTTGTITVNSTGGQLFDDDTSLTITVKNTSLTIQSDGTNWIII